MQRDLEVVGPSSISGRVLGISGEEERREAGGGDRVAVGEEAEAHVFRHGHRGSCAYQPHRHVGGAGPPLTNLGLRQRSISQGHGMADNDQLSIISSSILLSTVIITM